MIFYYKMRDLQIVDKKLEIYDDELQILEDFVEEKNGKIIWGMI